jgi:hypothetical protein
MRQTIDLAPAILPTGALVYSIPQEATALNLSTLRQAATAVLGRVLQKAVRALLSEAKAIPPATLLCAALATAVVVAAAVERPRQRR